MVRDGDVCMLIEDMMMMMMTVVINFRHLLTSAAQDETGNWVRWSVRQMLMNVLIMVA